VQKLLGELGQVAAVIGAQWGDEGKGKIVDILTEHYDVLARASGGANAGHTIVVEGEKHVFHLLPSGSLHERKPVILGSGMVIHLPTLLKEIETLEEAGIDIMSRLKISEAAHIVFDYHKKIDGVIEERRLEKVGTTMRGIGPCYADKAFRTGLRMSDLRDRDEIEIKRVFRHNASFVDKMFDLRVYGEEELNQLAVAKKKLNKSIANTVSFLHKQLDKKSILIEGAQATLLDIDHGTYPHVTSSQTTVTGALHALGLPPQSLHSCIGVVKAYCTRVGEGPFHTEVTGKRGDDLRERGGEYGATTGRARRCGWLDINDVKYAATLNGCTHLNLTKLDVLDAEETIPVFTGEKSIELPGWQVSTSSMTQFEDLPENAQNYVAHIEKALNIPVSFIGTGPGREEMIVRG
jgi:adenylosuccinate synthase